MDYHIVPNLTGQVKEGRKRKYADVNDWHFEAVLVGAAILILFLPLITLLLPGAETRVLGWSTQKIERVYDSEFGYYNLD